MTSTTQIYSIRTKLRKHGITTKQIPFLKVIAENDGITTLEIAQHFNITKQAISKQAIPLEKKGIISNTHPHPLWKAWTITDDTIRQLLTKHP